MKILLYIIAGIVLLISLALVVLSMSSRKQPALGLLNGQLRACPATPNCVCSEYDDNKAFVAPLLYNGPADGAWQHIRQAIIGTGGLIVTDHQGYLHARYETRLLRFIDDVEVRHDTLRHVIHVRSASRAGHSDLGANRKRVAKIRTEFEHLNGAPEK